MAALVIQDVDVHTFIISGGNFAWAPHWECGFQYENRVAEQVQLTGKAPL